MELFNEDESLSKEKAIIDIENAEDIGQFKWYLTLDGYAFASEVGYMHDLVIQLSATNN